MYQSVYFSAFNSAPESAFIMNFPGFLSAFQFQIFGIGWGDYQWVKLRPMSLGSKIVDSRTLYLKFEVETFFFLKWLNSGKNSGWFGNKIESGKLENSARPLNIKFILPYLTLLNQNATLSWASRNLF